MNKEELRKNLSDLFQELDQLGAEWERFRVEETEPKKENVKGFKSDSAEKECETTRQETDKGWSIINSDKYTYNAPLVYMQGVGNPLISRAEFKEQDNIFILDLIVPGVKDGDIKMSVLSDKITISFDNESSQGFTKNFSLTLKSDKFDFRGITVNKENGIMCLCIPGLNRGREKTNLFRV